MDIQNTRREIEQNWKNKEKFKVMIGDFNTFLSILNKTIRPKVNKELEDLNNMSNKVKLIYFHKTLN